MEARKLRCLTAAILLLTVADAAGAAEAASYQTVNFSVTARDSAIAEQVGTAAEVYRRQLAVFWLGKPLPNWSRPCKITVNEGSLGAGGQTTFQFVRGEVLNWRMKVQGSLERILDSVLPHEINHTIFACHFRRPLPRWADEGAATLFEHRSEQLKQLALLNEVISSQSEIISLRDLLTMKEYPRGQRPMLTLYAQGYALADFLVQQKGRHAYLKFISDGERGGWEQAIRSNFDHEGIDSLERNWRGWVLAGMPKLTLPREQMLVANEDSSESKAQAAARPEMPSAPETQSAPIRRRRTAGNPVIRSQSPESASKDERELPSSPSGSELSLRPGNALVPAPGMPALPEYRRASFEAPKPKLSHSETSQRISNRQAGDSTVSESFLPNRSLKSPGRAEEVNAEPLIQGRSEHAGLEPTGLIFSEKADHNAERKNHGSGFDFNRVLLPAERSVRSGRTPQWAGFPGQKKLF